MAEEETWEIPPKFLGSVPQATPGSSGGKVVEGDFPLDQVVIDEFSPGTVILSCNRYGASDWTCAEYDQGRAMLEGEFHSMNELYKAAPDLVPKPHS
ncbi:uncharacterized protein C8A04DRAFT_26989 [Dichotomopilus funicola]|uniref:Uncharacterized protein n=1 Tax=Dichotomopilus funicola TaxID=1934379 RepID=A0AAN6V5G1_9PEZI|nr:hypothetical protein C8A04DRAFT_26989 [Dichotomopilus funicola]